MPNILFREHVEVHKDPVKRLCPAVFEFDYGRNHRGYIGSWMLLWTMVDPRV